MARTILIALDGIRQARKLSVGFLILVAQIIKGTKKFSAKKSLTITLLVHDLCQRFCGLRKKNYSTVKTFRSQRCHFGVFQLEPVFSQGSFVYQTCSIILHYFIKIYDVFWYMHVVGPVSQIHCSPFSLVNHHRCRTYRANFSKDLDDSVAPFSDVW